MRLGAYQFAVSGNIMHNLESMRKAVMQAVNAGVDLLVFPECALTGYPPRDIEKAFDVNFTEAACACECLQNMAVNYKMHIIAGTITEEDGIIRNSAIMFAPDSKRDIYHKRALWGWDKENFSIGTESGIMDVDGMKIGIRICFEVRFPEFFRELYREQTDLNIILFYDTADSESAERYDLIKSHIRTRAVENVTHTLAVNTIGPYQTAPTLLYDRSGRLLCELEKNKEGVLIYDLEKKPLDFGELGRKEISDWLISGKEHGKATKNE